MKQIPALIESLSIAKSRILKDRDQKSNDLRQSDDEVAKDLDEVILFIKGLDKGHGFDTSLNRVNLIHGKTLRELAKND